MKLDTKSRLNWTLSRRWYKIATAFVLLPMMLPGCIGLDSAPRQWPGLLTTKSSGKPEPADEDGPLPPAEAARACFTTAEELVKAGHRHEAIRLYEKARQYNPQLQGLSRRLAVLYDQAGESLQAAAEYRRALQENPQDADLLNDLGYFHYRRKRWAEAETQLRRAVEINPKHEAAWTNLGLVLAGQGCYQEAFDAFNRAVGPAAAHSNVGVILAKHGRREEAVRRFRQALTLDPTLKQPQAFLEYLQEHSGPAPGSVAHADSESG